MTTDEIYDSVKNNKPKIIYVSGKTSTGKSTFTRRLTQDFGYKIIELDQMVLYAVIKPLKLPNDGSVFVEVYRNRDKRVWIQLFVQVTRDLIKSYLDNKELVIIEGALANPITLQEILAEYPELTFIYFHPKALDTYIRNLTTRFMSTNKQDRAGLPTGFWSMIDPDEFELFCKTREVTEKLNDSIKKYALLSQEESDKRLESFKSHFANIVIVEV
jgi:hypothetical protein